MCACDMCIERKREMNAAEFESGSCRFSNLNKDPVLQTF